MILGCEGGGIFKRPSYPNSPTPELKARFNAADALYRGRRFREADAAFEKFIAESPYTEFTDESRFRRGEIAFITKDYPTAVSFYREAVSDIASPSIAPKAHFKAALALSLGGQNKNALDELSLINRPDASAILRLRADSLGVKASKAMGASPNSSIGWNLNLLDDYADAQGVMPVGLNTNELVSEDAALTEVRRWVGDNLVTLGEVEALPMKKMRGKRSGGFVAYKLALILHSQGETKAAARNLRAFLTTYPKHEYYGSARLLLGEMGGVIGEGAGIVVGVLLPLSGRYATYGESTLHGIECAVGVFEPCVGPGGMKLIIRDSESTPGGARGAVEELAEEGVVAIVGPLLSAGAAEAAGRAQELGVPLISLSQREGIAEIGDYIFRNSISDSSEMTTLADYAVGSLHLKRFFILHTTGSKKGGEYRGLFSDAVRSQGGSVVAARSYSPVFTMPETGDELRGRGAVEFSVRRQQQEEGRGEEDVGDLTTGVGGFDAVFIPDSLSAAAYLVKRLGGAGNFNILGISRWDEQRLVDRVGSLLDGAVFVDSFYKNAPDIHVSSFVSRFREAYGPEPTLLEALGYDSMRLVINAVQAKGAVRRDSIRNALARTAQFPGVAGKTTFNEEGDAQREMWVLRIEHGTIRPIK